MYIYCHYYYYTVYYSPLLLLLPLTATTTTFLLVLNTHNAVSTKFKLCIQHSLAAMAAGLSCELCQAASQKWKQRLEATERLLTRRNKDYERMAGAAQKFKEGMREAVRRAEDAEWALAAEKDKANKAFEYYKQENEWLLAANRMKEDSLRHAMQRAKAAEKQVKALKLGAEADGGSGAEDGQHRAEKQVEAVVAE